MTQWSSQRWGPVSSLIGCIKIVLEFKKGQWGSDAMVAVQFLVTHRWKRDLEIVYHLFLNFRLVDSGSV